MPVTTILGPNGILLAVVPEDTKTDIRRFCGYAAYGYGTVGFFQMGGFFPGYQQLETRMQGLSVSEFARVTDLYLANLYTLEQDLFVMRETVNIDTAAVYKRNLNETRERHTEFMYWRKSLCNFVGVSPGNHMSSGSNNMNLVV